MLTGRANYRQFGQYIHVNLEDHPDLASNPDTAVEIACEFWKLHSCNPLADEDDLEAVTRRINGGINGLMTRKLYLERAKKAIAGVAMAANGSGSPDSDLSHRPSPAPSNGVHGLWQWLLSRFERDSTVKGS
jgi:putative chitinase